MSWIYEDPDEWELLAEGETQDDFPGSTVKFDLNGIGRRKLPPDEVALFKARRIGDHEDAILAEADIIRAQRLAREPRLDQASAPEMSSQVAALMAELVALRGEAGRRDHPAWRLNTRLSRKVEILRAPLEAIARLQLVTNNWSNATMLSSAIRMAETALSEIEP